VLTYIVDVFTRRKRTRIVITAKELRKSMEPDRETKQRIENKILDAAGKGEYSVEFSPLDYGYYDISCFGFLKEYGYKIRATKYNQCMIEWMENYNE
jgi:hypothetical protein